MAEKRVLVLGAGYVAAPLLEYFTRDKTVSVTVASALQHQGEALANGFDNVESVVVDVTKGFETLDQLVKESNLVISLLPYTLHPMVAESCIKNKVNMVTASYLSQELKNLHEAAVDAGISIVNEVGLDPGIDHLLAMECFDEVNQNGGKVMSFVSFCGGLPAPENSDNPLRYKFSWNPKGVLLNTLSPARYLDKGTVVDIPAGGALMEHLVDIDFLPGFSLEGYPNRDSIQYKDIYGIPYAHTILRGSLRYKGYMDCMKGIHLLGLLSKDPHPSLHPKGPEITWFQFMCTLLGQQDNILISNLKNLVYEQVNKSEIRAHAIERLGLLDEEPVVKMTTPIDTLTYYLGNKLAFGSGERDAIILRHNIEIHWSDNTKEVRHIDLVAYGDPNGYSAMAKLVGYPAAIAGRMVLEGEIQTKGMVRPMAKGIYIPMLKRLKQEGIHSTEDITKL